MTETQLVSKCLRILCSLGIDCWRQNTGGMYDKTDRFVRFGRKGSADISGILRDGRRLEVECKVGKNVQQPNQKTFQEVIDRNKGVYLLVYSPTELIDQLQTKGIA